MRHQNRRKALFNPKSLFNVDYLLGIVGIQHYLLINDLEASDDDNIKDAFLFCVKNHYNPTEDELDVALENYREVETFLVEVYDDQS
jgi:hypothetical protein